jgi:hypothetical protein
MASPQNGLARALQRNLGLGPVGVMSLSRTLVSTGAYRSVDNALTMTRGGAWRVVEPTELSCDEDCCSLGTTTWSLPFQRPAGAVLGCSPRLTSEHRLALAGTVRASAGESACWAHDVEPSVI